MWHENFDCLGLQRNTSGENKEDDIKGPLSTLRFSFETTSEQQCVSGLPFFMSLVIRIY